MVQQGPSSELISRIHHLAELLKNLPTVLPLNPPSSQYGFGLDTELVEEEGVWFAFNRNLEVCFETHKLGPNGTIVFRERGKQCEALIQMFKLAVKQLETDSEREFLREVWLERLIMAAKLQGAKIPVKRKNPMIIDKEVSASPEKRAKTQCAQPARSGSFSGVMEISEDSSDGGKQTKTRTVPIQSSHKLRVELSEKIKLAPPNWSTTVPTQLTFDDLRWKPLETEREKKLQWERLDALTRESWEEKQNEEEEERVERERSQREGAAERQRRHHERKRAAFAAEKKQNEPSVNQALQENSASVTALDVVELSRSDSHWKGQRNGTRGGTKQERHTRTNWYHPLLWIHIDAAARKFDWSPQAITKGLSREHPTLFSHLNKGTVQKWIDKGSKRQWSKVTLENVQRRHALAGSGQSGVLAKHPNVVKEITEKLQALRKSGLVVNVIIGRAIMLAVINHRVPDLLTLFKCSESFVRSFFESVLDWTPRKGTRVAAKLPADAEDKCEECFFRLVYIIKWHSVPPKLVVGFDQIGVYILPSSGTTFAERGSQQVDIVAKDEKRAYTLLVASTPEGTFLPFQQVWSGSTERSLPSPGAHKMMEAKERGFDFVFAKSNKKGSHFSTLKTMKEWVENIFEPYRRSVIEIDSDLDDDQVSIIYLDCYPVHAGQEFRTYVFDGFPHIILCFVPASCTGIFQPADVGLNRVIKHRLKQHQTQFLVDSHQQQINDGITPDQVKFTTSLPILRDASVAASVEVYDFMTSPLGRELVQKSWKKCTTKEWNLSAECLTSKKAQTVLNSYLRSHPKLHDEIENRTGIIHGLEDEPPESQLNAEADGDDTDIPCSAVIQDIFGIEGVDVAAADTAQFCVHDVQRGDGHGLIAAGDNENIWALVNEQEVGTAAKK